MTWNTLKSFMPRSLIGRTALILLVPIITIQLAISFVFIQRLYEKVTVQMTTNTVRELEHLVSLIEAAPDPSAAADIAVPVARQLSIILDVPAEGPETDDRLFYDLSGRVVMEELHQAFPAIRGIDLKTVDNRVHFTMDTSKGPVEVNFSRTKVSASNPHQLLVLMVFVSLVVTIIAFLFLRNQVRPIRRLAEAAEAFGRGNVLPYRPSGANEVRSAGQRFLEMRARIERHIEQLTLMLSGVSHDLRTPLTRLKLGLSMLPQDEEVDELSRDVVEMEQMLDSFLEFVRSQSSEEQKDVDPFALARDVVRRAQRTTETVSVGRESGEGTISLRPLAVGRALTNLVNNAVRYGTKATVSVSVTDRAVVFSVEDDGPGIPPELREEALKPFSRLDEARNQNKGTGVGLGLAIARDVARQHGGTLRLSASEDLGGLQADIVLSR